MPYMVMKMDGDAGKVLGYFRTEEEALAFFRPIERKDGSIIIVKVEWE